jgi:hypothetical protein
MAYSGTSTFLKQQIRPLIGMPTKGNPVRSGG